MFTVCIQVPLQKEEIFENSKGKPKKQKAKSTKLSKLKTETAFIGQLNTSYTFLFKKNSRKERH